MPSIIGSIEAEYRRYKALADGAMAQLDDADLSRPGPNGGNSLAVLVWHLAGNLASRFTDFLTTDGEKPWRHREEEFLPRTVTREELLQKWEVGWTVLFGALAAVTDAHLSQEVMIRGRPLQVHEALHRSLAHASYHVGQIVYLAKAFRGSQWAFLSIPPGGSDAYSRHSTPERPPQLLEPMPASSESSAA
jgi:hypothetical protein